MNRRSFIMATACNAILADKAIAQTTVEFVGARRAQTPTLAPTPQILASSTALTPTDLHAASASAAIPEGYKRVANEYGVPAALLFGIAMQESAMLLRADNNRKVLPWPWTINVGGVGTHFADRVQAEQRLTQLLAARTDLVDIGLMQVNWRYFRAQLVSPLLAFDPYWNLRVGASIVRDHMAQRNNWFAATGAYHAPNNAARAHAYASGVARRVRALYA
jgi:soluble lytic murein transglycosylase-like protein